MRHKCHLYHAVCLLILLISVSLFSCTEDDDTPRPLNGVSCSGDDEKRFVTDEDGNCTVCDTARGYIPMGEGGKFCFIPGEGAQLSYQRLLTFLDPAPPIIAGTFVWELGREFQPSGRLPYINVGNLWLGLPANDNQPNWLDSACADRDLYTALIENNPSFLQVSISTQDPQLPNGSLISFVIRGLDVNHDCQEDYGFASGEAFGDTVRLVVHWRSNDLPNPSGDTVRTDSALLYPLPIEYRR